MKGGGPCGEVWVPLPASSQLPECGLSWENPSLLPRGPSQGKAPPWALGRPSCLCVEVQTGRQACRVTQQGTPFPCQRAGAPP